MSDKTDAYFARAKSWALDEQETLRSTLRLTRVGAGVIAVIAILEAFALILLMPLKTVAPIPVLVDRQTGYVETLGSDGRTRLRADQALTQSLLAQYVIARESFDITGLSAAFRKVALWSAGQARQDYVSLIPAANPQSPLRLYPRSTIVDTRIKSVSPIGPNTELVRFETRRHDQDGRTTQARAWAAVINYRFSDAPLSVEDRLVNPLGFQVVHYHKDAETLTPPDPEPPHSEPVVYPAIQPAVVAAAIPTPATSASPAQSPGPPAAVVLPQSAVRR